MNPPPPTLTLLHVYAGAASAPGTTTADAVEATIATATATALFGNRITHRFLFSARLYGLSTASPYTTPRFVEQIHPTNTRGSPVMALLRQTDAHRR